MQGTSIAFDSPPPQEGRVWVEDMTVGHHYSLLCLGVWAGLERACALPVRELQPCRQSDSKQRHIQHPCGSLTIVTPHESHITQASCLSPEKK